MEAIVVLRAVTVVLDVAAPYETLIVTGDDAATLDRMIRWRVMDREIHLLGFHLSLGGVDYCIIEY